MLCNRPFAALLLIFLPLFSEAQLDKIVIPAGTPEDVALASISSEQDAQKKLTMYQDFVQQFSSNPAAVAYGNWQMAQAYQSTGDLEKAIGFGDKALAASPHNLDILVSQANIAQQMKSNAKLVDYAVRGGEAYNSIAKQTKPDTMSDQDFQNQVEGEKNSARGSYDFLEAAVFNAIADEKDPKARMSYIERFSAGFPDSRFQDQVAQYALYTLGPGQLNDPARLVAYGDKALAANPNSTAALLLMANHYVEDTKPTSISKAASYAEKVIALSKADAPDADPPRKLSAGVAHSTLGYALMKQDRTAAAIPHLKAASGLLKGHDDLAYATALYRLGWGYAKLNKVTEARDVLNEAVKISGPIQQPAQDLLAKVNAARAKGK
jgi:tetratricopeptide (TPR) repeat protein